ncbi:MAG: multiheme c-type cytochrome [Sorangiineae bacterium]|nr:multiheme c-type cytochrome [Polyangiaceae bacterium]MEB2322044.1 multiheme c-type cytochrome [Sorangiineae bacterium]
MPSRLLVVAAVVSLALGLVAGCKRAEAPLAAPPPKTPSVRLYVVSTLAGALEPCGCVKDMLGGVDKAASYVNGQSTDAPNRLVLGAGPMFFMDPELEPASRVQDEWKAEAIAGALAELGLVAWAPGANDWAAGADGLRRLASLSRARLLAANLAGGDDAEREPMMVESGGLQIGLAGISVPRRAGIPSRAPEASPPEPALRKALATLRARHAQIRVALFAGDRGEALRLAERVPGFQVMVVGKPLDSGEGNDAPTPPVLVGDTLVVEGPNHLQGIGVVDLYVRDGDFRFQDGSNLAGAARRESLSGKVRELERRLAAWQEPGSGVAAEDLEARRADLARAREELSRISEVPPPARGSFFRYELTLVRDSLGKAPPVVKQMDAYYRRVNDHNRVAFQDRVPAPVGEGQSGYVGVEVCTSCHSAARKFWDGTRHARAYATLSREHKEFNLDCVGCHVTGYGEPGGSTVSHVDKLENVQCEACHGPGSRHVAGSGDKTRIVGKPDLSLCGARCHHPPHVDASWSATSSVKRILGPGHGG